MLRQSLLSLVLATSSNPNRLINPTNCSPNTNLKTSSSRNHSHLMLIARLPLSKTRALIPAKKMTALLLISARAIPTRARSNISVNRRADRCPLPTLVSATITLNLWLLMEALRLLPIREETVELEAKSCLTNSLREEWEEAWVLRILDSRRKTLLLISIDLTKIRALTSLLKRVYYQEMHPWTLGQRKVPRLPAKPRPMILLSTLLFQLKRSKRGPSSALDSLIRAN